MTHTDQSTTAASPLGTVLSGQHQQAKAAMELVATSSGPDRRTAFTQLCYLLAAHEAAEEETLHRMGSIDLGADKDVVTARLGEEEEAGTAITDLEALDVESDHFATEFLAFQKAVIAHAGAEEHDELPALAPGLSAEQERRILDALAQVGDLAQNSDGQLTANGDTFVAMLGAAREHFHRLDNG
ncbi:MAG: hemerythrin domain-containing protein [Jatrophihabitantaceae bacterium]